MKILNAEQIRAADAYTIAHEPIASIDLMERAAQACVRLLHEHFEGFSFTIVCGQGNNGGDGLAIARLLDERGKNVHVYVIEHSKNPSADFRQNLERLSDVPRISVTQVNDASQLIFSENDAECIVDAIFGTGLNKPAEGLIAAVIQKINITKKIVVSIDIPSGLFCDTPTPGENIVNAYHTLSFQQVKYAFLFPETGKFVGHIEVLDIGLDKAFIDSQVCNNNFVLAHELKAILKKRNAFSHKGTYGHALILAGSKGKCGAAVLATKACLRSGAGLLTVHAPNCAIETLQTAIPEATCESDNGNDFIEEFPKSVEKYSVVAAGPGIGTNPQTQSALKILIQEVKSPLLLDADALNILSENKTWLSFLPPNTILTPHPKEFDRLAGNSTNSMERLEKAKEMSRKHKLIIVLKGTFTAVVQPSGEVYFNSSGNPGLAKGGSGDTLTGIITGLIARGYTNLEASILGVYLHGAAADIAIRATNIESLLASDVIDCIDDAITELSNS